MKVKVRDGYKINHSGKQHLGGDTVDAPDVKAQRWVDMGIAEKAVSGSKNKAVSSAETPNKADQGDDLASKSKDELYELAQERDIEGRSSMDKDELVAALREG